MGFNINEMTLGELKEIKSELDSLFGENGKSDVISGSLDASFVGLHCLFRTYSAGVFIGTLVAREGKEVVVSNCRRIWEWGGAFTLSEVSQLGIDPSKSRISIPEETKLLTELIELIPTTEKARETFSNCSE